jgi:hypothetical protein
MLLRFIAPMLGIVVGCLSLSGCGGTKGAPSLYRATGTVTYKDQAVPNAKVMFLGDGKSAPAVGVTDSNGRFVLRSLTGTGAPAGRHVVAIVMDIQDEKPASAMTMEEAAKAAQNPTKESKPASVIPSKYANAATSGLEFQVNTSGTNDFKIELND